MMVAVLRWAGLGKFVFCYRYVAFNGPRTTTALGIVLLLGVAAVRLDLLFGKFVVPAYLVAYFALIIAGAAFASVGMVVGRRPGPARLGWALGSLVSAASIVVYVVSRSVGLPGLSQLVGRWDFALGTFSLALAALFLALHFSVLIGMNVAYPQQRQWHD